MGSVEPQRALIPGGPTREGANGGRASEPPQTREGEQPDPVERLARKLYGSWRAMISGQVAARNVDVIIQYGKAHQLVDRALHGEGKDQENAKKEVDGRLHEFDQRELRAISSGYPPTTHGKAFWHGVTTELGGSNDPLAKALGQYGERLSHRDPDGKILEDTTSLREDIHARLEQFTSGMLNSAIQGVPESQAALYAVGHQEVHAYLRRRNEERRVLDTLIAYEVSNRYPNGEELVLGIFRRIAQLQLQLEEQLMGSDQFTRDLAHRAGQAAVRFGGQLLAALGDELARRAQTSEPQQLPPAGRQRLLPPPDTNK